MNYFLELLQNHSDYLYEYSTYLLFCCSAVGLNNRRTFPRFQILQSGNAHIILIQQKNILPPGEINQIISFTIFIKDKCGI